MNPTVTQPFLSRETANSPVSFRLRGIHEFPFYGREFGVEMRTCPNAYCECDQFELLLYMGQLVGTEHASFRISGNALSRTLDDKDEGEYPLSAASILNICLTTEDWNAIEQEWRFLKAMIIEDLDPRQLDFSIPFPDSYRRDPSTFVAFRDFFSLSYIYHVTFRDRPFQLIDSYCANHNCSCTSVLLTFITEGEEFFAILYDYHSHEIEIHPNSKDYLGIQEAEQVVQQLQEKFLGFDKLAANRNEVLRALAAADLKKRPLDQPAFLKTLSPKLFPTIVTNVGRNAPCPCGSGKKYKRCCGK